MGGSNFNWLTSDLVDAEYKRYILLAYLKKVEERFRENRLYPYYEELKNHYRNLRLLKDHKSSISESFPKELEGVDLKNFRLKYKRLVEDDQLMGEIDKILKETLPELEHSLEHGDTLRTHVLKAIKLRPVGVIPIHRKEGYLLLSKDNEIRTYLYRMGNIQDPDQSKHHLRLRTRFIRTTTGPVLPSFEAIKEQLIRDRPTMPNPATFGLETELEVPRVETLLPVAKQVLASWIVKHPGRELRDNTE